jgi:membrane associated rhomboid family serine protease/Zn-finger nucleic acid-binding protein
VYYSCAGCGGRAVTFPQIRRVAGDAFITQLLRRLNRAEDLRIRPCPFCTRRMRQFRVQEPSLVLDACKLCGAVWFDVAEFDTIPERPAPTADQVEYRGREIIAQYKVEQLGRQMKEDGAGAPDEGWKWIPALLGFPVEIEESRVERLPLMTWTIAAVIVIVSVSAFFYLEQAVRHFGLIPEEAFRYGGVTLITSFFLHGGVWHLLGNLYFLLLFGDNVEDHLGRRRFGLLVLAATLAGDLLHILGDPGSTTPCVGASGGISGVITFYALQYPHARLGFLLRFYWIRIPAWGALLLWVVLQCFGVLQQLAGFSNVSALAHLGGAAAGFGAWLLWRKHGSTPVATAGDPLAA